MIPSHVVKSFWQKFDTESVDHGQLVLVVPVLVLVLVGSASAQCGARGGRGAHIMRSHSLASPGQRGLIEAQSPAVGFEPITRKDIAVIINISAPMLIGPDAAAQAS